MLAFIASMLGFKGTVQHGARRLQRRYPSGQGAGRPREKLRNNISDSLLYRRRLCHVHAPCKAFAL